MKGEWSSFEVVSSPNGLMGFGKSWLVTEGLPVVKVPVLLFKENKSQTCDQKTV